MSSAEGWAAELVESIRGRRPEVVELAASVSLASRVEPALLRRGL